MPVTISSSPRDNTQRLVVEIEKQFDIKAEHSAIREAVKEVAKTVADKWLEENRDKVMERLNVDAIANMILLEVAKQTKDDILEKSKNND